MVTSSLACDCLALISLFGPLVELRALFLVLFSFDYIFILFIFFLFCFLSSRLTEYGGQG